ncbi:hypothetical protein HR060_08630 [Catenovulum sp. SM1970]|uniref:tetratricopeptide repeat protein n=1 Tax=Marinifaba aquimaris TaxID=2741323 RepID=UPI0015730DAF|nr:hypothetical protein [Marinifaba aquimaris]NTS76935.1 hypothetical protein [Marinifaba aquimaris]
MNKTEKQVGLGLIKATHLLLLTVIIICAYYNSLNVPFLFDDVSSILNKADIYKGSLNDLYSTFGQRVVAYTSFKIDYLLYEKNVTGYHATNILIHVLCCFTVYFLTFQIVCLNNSITEKSFLNPHITSLLVALFFALHPLQTQAVTYIVQRITALAALFYLATMLAFIKFRMSSKKIELVMWGSVIFISSLLAFYTKQNTFSLPVALFLIEVCLIKRINPVNYWKRISKLSISLFLLAVFAAFISFYLIPDLGSYLDRATRENQSISRLEYFETQLHVLLKYIQLYFIPLGQQVEYIYSLRDGTFSTSYFTILVWGFLLTLALVSAPKHPLICFSVFFYLIAHSIESSFIPISDLVFEHRTYLPNFGLIVLSVYCLIFIKQKFTQLFFVISAVILSLLFFLTKERNELWSQPEQLYLNELSHNFDKPRIHGMLGKLYINKFHFDKAEESYKNAFNLAGNKGDLDTQAYYDKYAYFNNYISALKRQFKYHQAIKEVNELMPSLAKSKYYPYLLINLGFLYFEVENYHKCQFYLMKALKYETEKGQVFMGLGQCSASAGDKDMARWFFSEAKRYIPNSFKLKVAMSRAKIQ